jgi:ABC-2 type transport system permease protein
VITWTVAVAALGTVMGAIAPSVGDLLDTPEGRKLMAELGGVGGLENALLAAVLAISAVVVTCFGLTVVGHTNADERDGRTEQVLATATSRSRSLVASLLVALLGSAWLLAVTGLATGVGLGRSVGTLLGAGLAQVPAVWVILGVGTLFYAVRSSWTALGWVVLGLCFALGELGELLHLPNWLTDVSPYQHTPAMPAVAFRAAPELVLLVVASALLVAAWLTYQERDIV